MRRYLHNPDVAAPALAPATPSTEDDRECAICSEPLTASATRGPARRLLCGHEFHGSCIDGWARSDFSDGCCPICRAPLDEHRPTPKAPAAAHAAVAPDPAEPPINLPVLDLVAPATAAAFAATDHEAPSPVHVAPKPATVASATNSNVGIDTGPPPALNHLQSPSSSRSAPAPRPYQPPGGPRQQLQLQAQPLRSEVEAAVRMQVEPLQRRLAEMEALLSAAAEREAGLAAALGQLQVR
eukprot:tig00020876_g14847.t1